MYILNTLQISNISFEPTWFRMMSLCCGTLVIFGAYLALRFVSGFVERLSDRFTARRLVFQKVETIFQGRIELHRGKWGFHLSGLTVRFEESEAGLRARIATRDEWRSPAVAWVLSLEEDAWRDAAQLGINFLDAHGFDPADGRMWFHVTRDGTPLRKRRSISGINSLGNVPSR